MQTYVQKFCVVHRWQYFNMGTYIAYSSRNFSVAKSFLFQDFNSPWMREIFTFYWKFFVKKEKRKCWLKIFQRPFRNFLTLTAHTHVTHTYTVFTLEFRWLIFLQVSSTLFKSYSFGWFPIFCHRRIFDKKFLY